MEIIAPQIMQWQKRLNLFNLLANGFSSTTTKLKHSQKEKDNNAHMYVYIYAQKNGHYLFSFKITKLFFLCLWLKNDFYRKKKKGTQQLQLVVSVAMKGTIFTREWLKEKGNIAYMYVSIHVYTYTQVNEHYFITKHLLYLLLKKSFLQRNGHYSYDWRCFMLCTMQHPHMNSEKRHVHT